MFEPNHGLGVARCQRCVDTIEAFTVASNKRIYVGGDFSDAGGSADGDSVAYWEAGAWNVLVGGAFHPPVDVRTIAADPINANTIYAGGHGSGPQLVRWNGTTWSFLGAWGTEASVETIAIAPNGHVYVGGSIENTTTYIIIPFVWMWNGIQWVPLATMPFFGAVNSIAISASGEVLAGGEMLDGTTYWPFVCRLTPTGWKVTWQLRVPWPHIVGSHHP